MVRYAPMTAGDLDAVVAVEQVVYPFPWSRGNFADSLAAGHGAWLAHEHGRMTAYAVTMQVLDESHLLNLTVPPEHQRHGRGAAMLTHLLGLAREAGVLRMLLEVRPGNLPGQALYRRYGFVEIGRRRDYYPAHGGREDAIVMACKL